MSLSVGDRAPQVGVAVLRVGDPGEGVARDQLVHAVRHEATGRGVLLGRLAGELLERHRARSPGSGGRSGVNSVYFACTWLM